MHTMLKQILTGAGGAIVAVVILTLAERASGWYSNLVLTREVPDGAVTIFNVPKCPEEQGWIRTTIVAGDTRLQGPNGEVLTFCERRS